MIDHADIARAAFDASTLPPVPRSVESALGYITRLLSMLPPAERAGYVKGPIGGENVATLPDGTLVRVSRVMYPNGDIYKVLTDAPNGWPQWHYEDLRPELYVPYAGTIVPNPGTGEDATLKARVGLLEVQVKHLNAVFAEIASHITAINQQIATLSQPKPEPSYVVRVFGYDIPVRKK